MVKGKILSYAVIFLFILLISIILDDYLKSIIQKNNPEDFSQGSIKLKVLTPLKFKDYQKKQNKAGNLYMVKNFKFLKENNVSNKRLIKGSRLKTFELETRLAPEKADQYLSSKLLRNGWSLKNWKQLGVTKHGCWSYFQNNISNSCCGIFISSSRIDISPDSKENLTNIKIIYFNPNREDEFKENILAN